MFFRKDAYGQLSEIKDGIYFLDMFDNRQIVEYKDYKLKTLKLIDVNSRPIDQNLPYIHIMKHIKDLTPELKLQYL